MNHTEAKCTQYNIMQYSLSVTCGRSVFFLGTPVYSTNKTDHCDQSNPSTGAQFVFQFMFKLYFEGEEIVMPQQGMFISLGEIKNIIGSIVSNSLLITLLFSPLTLFLKWNISKTRVKDIEFPTQGKNVKITYKRINGRTNLFCKWQKKQALFFLIHRKENVISYFWQWRIHISNVSNSLAVVHGEAPFMKERFIKACFFLW